MQDWSGRLKRLKKRGKLTTGDLRWLFAQNYWTVRQWVVNNRVPNGEKADYLFAQLANLEQLLDNSWLPVPATLGRTGRAEHMRFLGGKKLGRANLLVPNPSKYRLVRGVRAQGGRQKAAVVPKHRRTAAVAEPAQRKRI